jgi:hypothetical protein
MEELMDDPYSKVPPAWRGCPECNGYSSSLMEETERCTRSGGSGLVMVAEPAEEPSNGHNRLAAVAQEAGEGARAELVPEPLLLGPTAEPAELI